jgi:hypothetical protein
MYGSMNITSNPAVRSNITDDSRVRQRWSQSFPLAVERCTACGVSRTPPILFEVLDTAKFARPTNITLGWNSSLKFNPKGDQITPNCGSGTMNLPVEDR